MVERIKRFEFAGNITEKQKAGNTGKCLFSDIACSILLLFSFFNEILLQLQRPVRLYDGYPPFN